MAKTFLQLLSAVSGIQITCPIMNGAGIIKHREDLLPFLNKDLENQIILAGSFSLDERAGNTEGEVWHIGKNHTSNTDLNKLGLPNPGKEGLIKLVEEFGSIINGTKILGVSIAEFTIEGFLEMLEVCKFLGIKYVQVNTSCGNVMAHGKQKPIFCYNLEMLDTLLDGIDQTLQGNRAQTMVVDIKVSAYLDTVMHAEVVDIVTNHVSVGVISTVNTLANGRRYINSAPVIGIDGYGGVSGPGIFPIAVGQVHMWRSLLPESIRVCGIGGITTGKDMQEMMWSGADGVQITSAYLRRLAGTEASNETAIAVFNEIYAEYLEPVI